MIKYSHKELNEIKKWGTDKNPFIAIEDFSFLKCELRWLNNEHNKAYKKYWDRRYKWTNGINFKKYYKKANKPIDKRTWDYLRIRKSYYIMPLGWENIAKNGGTVLDLGCGDGDVTQNLINFIAQYQKKKKINKAVNIIGVDINKSRIINAKKMVHANYSNINVNFITGNVISEKLNFKNGYFDYCLCAGVLEILDEKNLHKLLNKLKKIVKIGIYIEDVFEKFPGGWPRDNIGLLLKKIGFNVKKREVVFTEPFSEKKLTDPKKLWPIIIDQNIWAERS